MKFRTRALMLIMTGAAAAGGLTACSSGTAQDTAEAIETTEAQTAEETEVAEVTEATNETTAESGTRSVGTFTSSYTSDTQLDAASMGIASNAAEELNSGNEQYLSGRANMDVSSDLREELVSGQKPHTIVITCSDSRVPPELIFNADLGELFTIRTAGNVVGEYEVGSVEYAADHLGSQLILVMGHTNCGAVGAAIEGHADGNIASIVEEIVPSVEEAEKTETDEAAIADKAEDLNVENTIARLRESSIISELENSGKVKILGAKYDIETGKVTYFEE